jgi:hypothetical protein
MDVLRVVSAFVTRRGFLVFCSGTCICFGFLFGVYLQLFSGCMTMCGPMCELSKGVFGIDVGLVVVFCCVGILSRP